MKLARVILAAAVMGLTFAAAPPHQAAYAQAYNAADLSGAWRGMYGGGANQPTEFEVRLAQNGTRLTGTITESANFGNGATAFLLAELSGRAPGNGTISFTKTYTDDAAGVTHSVQYTGRVSAGGRRIQGTWSVDGLNGVFEMVR